MIYIKEFNNECNMQQMHNPQLLTPFLTWKKFQHLEGSLMDDYHEFKPIMQRLKNDNCIVHMIMFPSLKVLWPQELFQFLVQLWQFSIPVLLMETRILATQTMQKWWCNPSTNRQCPMPIFNFIVEFFQKL